MKRCNFLSGVGAAGGVSLLSAPAILTMARRAAAQEDEIRVGLLFSLTGSVAVVESTLHDAALMAIEEINAAGGINGRQLSTALRGSCMPRDRGADELLQQINRIGCNFDQTWPIPKSLPERVDLIFVDVTDQPAAKLKTLFGKRERPVAIVAIVGYENPSVLELILEIGAHSVLMKPVRAIGVLGSMLMARRYQSDQIRFERDLEKLREKLENVQKVNDAKFILMRHRGITEREAYDLIRKQAMSKRTTTTEIAQAIINAESILSGMGGS